MLPSFLSERTATPAIRQQTHVDCVHLLISLAPGAAMVSTIGALALALWLRGTAEPAPLLGWTIAVVALSVVRLVFYLSYRRGFNPAQAGQWERRYALLMATTGLAWGALAWLPASAADSIQQTITVVVVFCIVLVGTSTLTASAPTYAAFTLAIFALLLPRLFTLPVGMLALSGWGGSGLLAILLLAFRLHHRSLVTAIDSHHRSQHILHEQQVIFDSAGEGIAFLRPSPEYVVKCNQSYADVFGYNLDEMQGMTPWQWHPSRAHWKQLVIDSSAVISAGKRYHRSLQLRRKDGSLFWGEVTGMAVDPGDLKAGTVWVVSDLSEQLQAEAALRVSEQRFRDLVTLSSDLYWEQDAEFRFTKFDGPEAIVRKLPLARFIGHTRWELSHISGVSQAHWQEHIEALKRHEPFRDFVYQLEGNDGKTRWLSISGNPLFDGKGEFAGYHGTSSDVTSRILSEERFRHLAYHDTLTQLPNRRLLEDRLAQAIRAAHRKGQRLALLLIDLDGFKRVNDHFGHATGDQVLEAVASRLRKTVRDVDTVARLGGDEFVVLLAEIAEVEDAVLVADKIHDGVAAPIAANQHQVVVGTSVGISVYPEHGDDPATLLRSADHAMYHGKHRGGKTTRIFDPGAQN